jgi:hypothetical protein
LIGVALIWLASTIVGVVDRNQRTETIEGVGTAGPIHLAPDGRILFAASSSSDAADGRIEAFDPATRVRTTVLDGVVHPIAADIAPDGTICAIGRPVRTDQPAQLRCSSGLAVDFVAGTPSGLADVRPSVADIVSDGSTGWVVTDPDRTALLHVDHAGAVVVLATIHQYPTLRGRPNGLARDGTRILVAIGEQGYTQLSTADRGIDVRQGSWVGGGFAVAVAAKPHGLPLVVVIEATGAGFLTYPVMADAERPRLTEGLSNPRGVVLLPDGRVAVSTLDRLVIVRSRTSLP